MLCQTLADVVTSDGLDLTPDGHLDAILFCIDTGALAVMPGNGMGGFGPPVYSSLNLNSPLINYDDEFAVGAFDPYSAEPLVVYRHDPGHFTEDFCYLNPAEQDPACDFAPPNGDSPTIAGPMVPVYFVNGQQSLLTLGLASLTSSSYDVVIWTEDGEYAQNWTPTVVPFGATLGQNDQVAAGDLNGDGHPDIFDSSSTSSGGELNTRLSANGDGDGWEAPETFASIPDTTTAKPSGRQDPAAVRGDHQAAVEGGRHSLLRGDRGASQEPAHELGVPDAHDPQAPRREGAPCRAPQKLRPQGQEDPYRPEHREDPRRRPPPAETATQPRRAPRVGPARSGLGQAHPRGPGLHRHQADPGATAGHASRTERTFTGTDGIRLICS